MNDDLISVIIPTYNRSSVIGRAIKSVLIQTWQNFEIIVVDDGSTDDTNEEVRNFKDSRIQYIRHEVNQNGAVARNTGIIHSRGEYVAFLDSDDEWKEKKLEKQLQQFWNSTEKRFISYTQCMVDDGTRKRIIPVKGKQNNESVADYLFVNEGLMQTSTLMIPRYIAIDNFFNPHLEKHQDWDLCIKLEKKGFQFKFLNEPLVKWHNEENIKRVSKTPDYNNSLKWLKSIDEEISRQARTGFLAKTVGEIAVQQGKKYFAIKLLLTGLLFGGVSIQDFFKRLICYIFPIMQIWRGQLIKFLMRWKIINSIL